MYVDYDLPIRKYLLLRNIASKFFIITILFPFNLNDDDDVLLFRFIGERCVHIR